MKVQRSNSAIIFFDGVCNLCNGVVQFILRHDKGKHFLFAPLQGSTAQQVLTQEVIQESVAGSFVYFEDGKIYNKSVAALKIAQKLHGWPQMFAGLIIVPKLVRDWGYSIIARNRYKWFGKQSECMFPTPELIQRFLP